MSSELNTKECQFQSYFFCSIEVCDARPPQECQSFVSIRMNHFSSRFNHWVEGSCHVRYMRYTCKNVGKIMALELNQTCYKNAGVCQTLLKITQPKLDSGLYLRKNSSFRPSSFSSIQQRSLKQKQKKTGTTKNGFAVFNQGCNTSDDSYAHQQSCKTH